MIKDPFDVRRGS